MANEMTAAALIALLRERPGACELLRVRIETATGPCAYVRASVVRGRVSMYDDDNARDTAVFRQWLTGAADEQHEELGIWLPDQYQNGKWRAKGCYAPPTGDGVNRYEMYPTRLHALLAGLEAHAKEKSNG